MINLLVSGLGTLDHLLSVSLTTPTFPHLLRLHFPTTPFLLRRSSILFIDTDIRKLPSFSTTFPTYDKGCPRLERGSITIHSRSKTRFSSHDGFLEEGRPSR